MAGWKGKKLETYCSILQVARLDIIDSREMEIDIPLAFATKGINRDGSEINFVCHEWLETWAYPYLFRYSTGIDD